MLKTIWFLIIAWSIVAVLAVIGLVLFGWLKTGLLLAALYALCRVIFRRRS